MRSRQFVLCLVALVGLFFVGAGAADACLFGRCGCGGGCGLFGGMFRHHGCCCQSDCGCQSCDDGCSDCGCGGGDCGCGGSSDSHDEAPAAAPAAPEKSA